MEMLTRDNDQADRVSRFKGFMKGLARNMGYYICLISPLAVVGSVWFDMTPTIAWRIVYGGLPLLVVFVMAERAMMDIGKDAGKADRELLDARAAYRSIRARAVEVGTSDMQAFIDEEIQAELEHAKRTACRKLRLDYETYLSKCASGSRAELEKQLGSRTRAAKVYAIGLIRPIVLTVDMILSDSPTSRQRGGIGKTGEEYLDEKKGLRGTAWAVLSVFLVTGFAIGPARVFSWQIVAYTVWALLLLFYRMARGYKNGVMAYAQVQVRNYEDRVGYLERFLEWKGKRFPNQNGDGSGC